MMLRAISLSFTFLALVAIPARAQWDPSTGHWGKTDARDVRVMTFNTKHTMCSTNNKVEGKNNWCALARIVAAMQPDVLLLQECGDNVDNGTGSSNDSDTTLTTAVHSFFQGGNDPFKPGNPAITSWVGKYAPGYDLPFVYASTVSDGFIRNVIASRWPFTDLNGDTFSQLSNIPTISPDAYSPGGSGGIRGFMTVEVDLPDALYAGNVVVGNAHLKSGSSSGDQNQRILAAKNIAYFIDYFWNGAGTGLPDPNHKIADNPPATKVLDNETPFLLGGDWNEDEATDGVKGPADWITKAATTGGTDGTDRDRTDMQFDSATDVFTGGVGTIGFGSTKFDYSAWQDSLVTQRRAFIFNSSTVPAADMPSELAGFTGGASGASATASDHRPVIADYVFVPALGCDTAAIDEGFAKIGGNHVYPTFAACGNLATGGSATLTVTGGAPSAAAFVCASFTAGMTNVLGGTLVPTNATVFGPLFTDAAGDLAIPNVPGGGGPFTVHAQWVISDPLAAAGASFSNALGLQFGP